MVENEVDDDGESEDFTVIVVDVWKLLLLNSIAAAAVVRNVDDVSSINCASADRKSLQNVILLDDEWSEWGQVDDK